MSTSSLRSLTAVAAIVALAFAALCGRSEGGAAPLQVGFYAGKCRSADVEAVVGGVVRAWFYNEDSTIAAALLRLQFHDCFVNVSS